jgi:uncharacterized membrane protein
MKTLLYVLLRYLFVTLFCIFCLAYPFAVAGIAFDVHPPFSLDWAASVLLFLEGTLLILAAVLLYGARRALTVGLLLIVLSYLVETLGVNSGFPFGVYHYTGVLFPSLPGSVPLAVMFAWVLIVLGTYGWIQTGRRVAGILASVVGAFLATLLDLAIEPVAAHIVHYWQWLAPGTINYYGVPLANFIAWFLVALALLVVTGRLLVKPVAVQRFFPTSIDLALMSIRLAWLMPRLLFCASLFMFGLVDLTHGYYAGTVAAGSALLVLRISGYWYRQ